MTSKVQAPVPAHFSSGNQDPFNLPFPEAIDYWKGKIKNLPTERWTDTLRESHARAFVVAGATKAELLDDLHSAVQSAITDGTTLAEFRKNFRQIVKKNGWSYKGEESWRTRTIYTTNLATAYSAGQWKQMTDPDVLKSRPYLRYRHNYYGVSIDPRPEHKSWNNVVLPADDPWWATHFTPNGWGCKCGVESITAVQAEAITGASLTGRGKRDNLPRPKNENTFRDWINPSTGETESIPWGITPGWDYNPGVNSSITALYTSVKMNKLPEPLATAFHSEMADHAGKTFKGAIDDWVEEIHSGKPFHGNADIRQIGWFKPEILKAINTARAAQNQPEITNNAIVAEKNQTGHGLGGRKGDKQLSIDDAKAIPEIISNPEEVRIDGDAVLLVYPKPDDKRLKLVVKLDYTAGKKAKKKTVNMLHTAAFESAGKENTIAGESIWKREQK